MNNQIEDLIDKVGSSLELSKEDLIHFREAADHDIKCKCYKCKKYHLIMKGKYKS